MSLSQTPQPLISTLQKLLPLLEQFLHILEKEKVAITQLDAAQLTELSQAKTQVLDKIFPLSQQLKTHLPPDQTLKKMLQSGNLTAEDKSLIKHFIQVSETAEQQHHRNGLLLMHTVKINENLLNILLGKEQDPTYQGKITGKSFTASKKTLGKA